LIRALKLAIVLVVVLTVLILLMMTTPVGLFVMAGLGRTYQCSFQQTLASRRVQADRTGRMRAIRSSMRRIDSSSRLERWNTRDGDYWIPTRDVDSLAENLAEQEQDVYGAETGIRPGDVVLDCGANVGVFTARALRSGASKVIAIEPAPDNVECLRRNFSDAIARGSVVIQAVAVWKSSGTTDLIIDGDTSARDSIAGHFEHSVSRISVPVTTIDEMATTLALDHVDLIKMDIEGAERQALEGAHRTLARFRPRLAIAMEHLDDDPIQIPRQIARMNLGFSVICGPCLPTNTRVRPDTLWFVAKRP